ncbi:MAG: glycosyltransferase family 2 protein [bacterium]|nr:glycosyltransferase family 2 protein [bacterium]
MKSVLVVPAFNEKSRIIEVLKKASKFVDNVIVIDDGSTDNTYEIIKSIGNNVIALRHKINLGKGAAMKTGCEAAIKIGTDIIIFMDADGQHNPKDIPSFINKIKEENLDIVFGSRKIGKDMPLVMMLGNKFLSIATSLLFGIYISDTQSGFRAFKMSVYDKIKWNSTRYSVETEIIVNASKKKLRRGEVEIETIYNDDYKGTTILDGIRIFINMLIWRVL